MRRACVNSGGPGSIVRLDCVPVAEEEITFGERAAAALACWSARPGMIVTLMDAEHYCWRARLTALDRTGGRLIPFKRFSHSLESPIAIDIYQALPDKERFELILEKLTELGVSRIVPMVTTRSATVAERDAVQKKSHRWPDVVRRAAIQCRRAMIPELSLYIDFSAALEEASAADLRLFLYEGESGSGLHGVLEGQRPERIALMVGPEGGFTADELEHACRAGFEPIAFGPRILRTETVAMTVLAVLQYELGDLDGLSPFGEKTGSDFI